MFGNTNDSNGNCNSKTLEALESGQAEEQPFSKISQTIASAKAACARSTMDSTMRNQYYDNDKTKRPKWLQNLLLLGPHENPRRNDCAMPKILYLLLLVSVIALGCIVTNEVRYGTVQAVLVVGQAQATYNNQPHQKQMDDKNAAADNIAPTIHLPIHAAAVAPPLQAPLAPPPPTSPAECCVDVDRKDRICEAIPILCYNGQLVYDACHDFDTQCMYKMVLAIFDMAHHYQVELKQGSVKAACKFNETFCRFDSNVHNNLLVICAHRQDVDNFVQANACTPQQRLIEQ